MAHTSDTQPTPSQHLGPQPTPTGYVQHSHLTVDHIGRLLLLLCQRLVRRLHGISHGGQVGLGLGELVQGLLQRLAGFVTNPSKRCLVGFVTNAW